MLSTLEIAREIAGALNEAGVETAVVEGDAEQYDVRALTGMRAESELSLGPWTLFRQGVRETVAHALRGNEEYI